jgi:hypothetical protein
MYFYRIYNSVIKNIYRNNRYSDAPINLTTSVTTPFSKIYLLRFRTYTLLVK